MDESLTTENGRTVLRMRRRLAHPPEKVWRALTEPAELAHWFPAPVELDPRPDGRIVFGFGASEDDEESRYGVVRVYEPPRLLEFTWGDEIQRWELAPVEGGCELSLTTTYDDRPGSASFTSGWLRCLDALDQRLGGRPAPREPYPVLHERYVAAYGLDAGEVLADGSVRFERQLTRPKEEVWAEVTGPAGVRAGLAPPAGVVAQGLEPGGITEVEAPVRLVYPVRDGVVSWQLRDGNGGARLVITQTGPAANSAEAWRTLVEELAASLAGRS